MTIPERLTRIVRHKISEIRERLDQIDDASQAEAAEKQAEAAGKQEQRSEARRELEAPSSIKDVAAKSSSTTKSTDGRRTPAEIVGSSQGSTGNQNATRSIDPLEYHYRLLGLEPGQDLSTVQEAYNRLVARSDPKRFPAGSAAEKEVQLIRERVEASYRALYDALDPTARRFDLLEIDSDTPAHDRG